MPQALQEGTLELLPPLPGQLLGDHAAVTQAGPQPVGVGARGCSGGGTLAWTPIALVPGCALPFPNCVPWSPTPSPTLWTKVGVLLSLGRTLGKAVYLRL